MPPSLREVARPIPRKAVTEGVNVRTIERFMDRTTPSATGVRTGDSSLGEGAMDSF